MPSDERDLYEYFAEVRREEEARVPPFSILPPAAHQHRRGRFPGKLVAATTCLATMIAVVAWLLPGSRVPRAGLNHGREQATASITTWKPATNFLLDTPGRELLEDVPAIGEWHGEGFAPGPGERHRHFSKQMLP